MEIEKKHKLTKRRSVHSKVSYADDGESCDDELVDPPPRAGKEKSRTKPRRRKNSSNTFDEDIIDGFAIISFKSFEDLENVVKNSMNAKNNEKNGEGKINHANKPKIKKKVKKNCSPPSPHLSKLSDSYPERSPSSDRTEDLSDTPTATHPRDRTLSDASFQSSSGRGYECDSESGDERASDASFDIFSTVNHNRECLAPSTTSCSSPCPTPVTTTTSTSTNNSDLVDSALTSVAAATSAYTTATATAPTPSATTATSPVSSATTSVSSATSRVPVTTAVSTPLTPSVTRSPNLTSTGSRSRPSSSTPSHRDQRKYSPTPVKTPRREELIARERDFSREKDFPLPSSVQFNKPWASGNAPGHLFHPNSPGLSSFSLHSTPPSHHPPSFPSLSSLHPHPTHPTPPGNHSMFAAPLPPGATLTSPHSLAGATNPAAAADSMSIASQEILREELNRRFLDAQGRSSLSSLTPTPYLRQDIHQHQHMHQHQHQHTHQHMYPLPPPFTPGSLVPSPAPHLFDKLPKPFMDSPFYPRTASALPGYPTVSPLLHGANPGPLNSGIPGAFQPKGVGSSLHPSAVMFASLHGDREKAIPGPSAATLPQHKKSGKWCAMHVKIAWEIHQHQQKQAEASKGGDSGAPTGHLLGGSSLRRPGEIPPSNSFLGSHSGSSNSILESTAGLPSHLGMSFPRPSPYSAGLGGFGGLGGSPFAPGSGREVPRIPGITPPQEWSRLHRTPPAFPPSSTWSSSTPSSTWSRLEDRDRRQDEDRDREKRNGERQGSLEERSRDREPGFHNSDHRHSQSRSRSRSPLVNGRVGSAKSDGSYEKPALKIKEERREDDPLERERDKMRNDYLLGSMGISNPLSASLIERARYLGGPYPLDRMPPTHPGLWSSMDKSAVDINHHRLQLQQEMEQARERMLSRLQPSHSVLEQERLRKEELLMQEERLRYFERFPMFDRERLGFDPRGLPPSMRHPDLLGPGHFPRTVSPLINHSGAKSGSPSSVPGAPPPLIPSASTTSRSHSNSPAIGKQKISSSVDSDKHYSNSNDPDVHNR